MLFSGKGTPDCRRSFPIKCRACFGRVGLRDGYAVNGSSVFAESGFERNRSLFPTIVRIVVARLIYGGRLTIPAGFRERLCRTTPPIPYVRHGRLFRSAGEIWLRWRQVEKSLAAEHAFSRKASFPFVTTGKAARCRRPWDRSSFRIVRLRGGTFLRMRVPCYRSLCYGISCFCRAEDGLLTMSAAVRGKR